MRVEGREERGRESNLRIEAPAGGRAGGRGRATRQAALVVGLGVVVWRAQVREMRKDEEGEGVGDNSEGERIGWVVVGRGAVVGSVAHHPFHAHMHTTQVPIPTTGGSGLTCDRVGLLFNRDSRTRRLHCISGSQPPRLLFQFLSFSVLTQQASGRSGLFF